MKLSALWVFSYFFLFGHLYLYPSKAAIHCFLIIVGFCIKRTLWRTKSNILLQQVYYLKCLFVPERKPLFLNLEE